MTKSRYIITPTKEGLLLNRAGLTHKLMDSNQYRTYSLHAGTEAQCEKVLLEFLAGKYTTKELVKRFDGTFLRLLK